MNLHERRRRYNQQQPTATDTILIADNRISFRLAPGEAWNKATIGLAMLVTSEDYQQTRIGQALALDENRDKTSKIPTRIIRRNDFHAEYEPSRHEMRVFDDLDGMVTEM